jgi:hypothetical protein
MTEEEMRKGYWYGGEPIVKFDPTNLSKREATMNAAPEPSLEARLNCLEADASAQRTAILKQERAFKSFAFHCCIALAVYAAALVVLLT